MASPGTSNDWGGRVRRGLAWIAGAIAFVLIVYGTIFGLYGWRILHSERMAELSERSRAYGCIGPVHDSTRPRAAPELQLARYYLSDGFKGRTPHPWWLRFAMASRSIDFVTDAGQANRMYAALPHGHFDSFNAVAREYAGMDYCALDPGRRQAVLDLYAIGSHSDVEARLRSRPAA